MILGHHQNSKNLPSANLYFVNIDMGRKGPEISPEVRKLAVDLHQNGHRLCEISKLLQLSYMTVSNIIKRFVQTGSVENKARSGRPKVVTDRDYRKLERLVKVNRWDSLNDNIKI